MESGSRDSVPGLPTESLFSNDGTIASRTDTSGYRETMGSMIVKTASVREATRAKLVTVKNKASSDGGSGRSSEDQQDLEVGLDRSTSRGGQRVLL